MPRLAHAVLALTLGGPALADGPRVVGAEAVREGAGWRFDVTVAHAHEGWDHYADAWRIRTPGGEILGTREFLHPHVAEQPSPARWEG